MPRHLILVRHGQSAINAQQDQGRRLFCGQLDTPLTELGRRQATELGLRLAQRQDLAITHAVSSTLGRARDTLALILACLPATIVRLEPSPRLNERSLGSFEGLSEEEVFARWPAYRDDADLSRFRADLVQKAPGGENLTEVAERTWGQIEWARGGTEGDLLVVSHCMAIRCLLGRALGGDVATWIDAPVKHSRAIVLRGPAGADVWAGRMERLE